jgi:hypothetical protein
MDICSNNSHRLVITNEESIEVVDVSKVLYELSFCLYFFSFPAYFDLDSLSKTLTRAITADLASATLVLAFSY